MTEQALEPKATALGGYLVIARYNRDRWNHLAGMDQLAAHKTAEKVFPEDDERELPQNLAGMTVKHLENDPLKGVQMLRSFHTSLFSMLIDRLAENDLPPERKPKKTPTEVVDAMMVVPSSPADTHEEDPGIGWLAIVDSAYLPSFVAHLGGREGPLWRMYDIEVIPLNDDKTTKDIYAFMTPVNWNK
jgi:hypothetical protein